MNLVAYEYVASQHERKGVLLVSEFAGAAEQLTGSLLFNPWNVDEMVDSIGKALAMGNQERAAMHKKSEAYVMENTR